MNRTRIQLTDEEQEGIEALDDLFDDDTINNIRESEARRLAIKAAEAIFRTAADRSLQKNRGR
jgi:S-adenosylmethionine:diacylglycerol 3-amino-3-carboxypropyl transferase